MLIKLLQRTVWTVRKFIEMNMQYHPQEISGSKNRFPSDLLYIRVKRMQTQKRNRKDCQQQFTSQKITTKLCLKMYSSTSLELTWKEKEQLKCMQKNTKFCQTFPRQSFKRTEGFFPIRKSIIIFPVWKQILSINETAECFRCTFYIFLHINIK